MTIVTSSSGSFATAGTATNTLDPLIIDPTGYLISTGGPSP